MQVLGARVARIQALAALGQRGQCRRGAFQCLRQRLERAIDRVALAHARPRTALAVALQRQAQVAHGRLDRRAQRRQRGLGPGLGGGLAQRVLLELDQLARGHGAAEELAGQFRHLVGLVQHEGVGARQDLAEALALDREVGEQQVMVDHQHVGFLRRAPRLDHEAVLVEGALGAEAVLRGRGHARPHAGVLGHAGQLGDVAGLGARGPAAHQGELRDFGAAAEAAFVDGAVEAMTAQVVRAALEQRGLQARTEHFAHARQVAVEELVLQGLGPGRHDHAQPREQRRHQVGEGLAGAGAGFHDQLLVVGDRLLHRRRHALLHLARGEVRHAGGEGAVGSKGDGGGRGLERFGHRRKLAGQRPIGARRWTSGPAGVPWRGSGVSRGRLFP